MLGAVEYREVEPILRSGKADAAVILRYSGNELRSQIIVDAANTNTAQTATAYIENILGDRGAALPVLTRTLYNPQLNSAYNFVPGIMGMIFILICAMMTSVSIVREKESGTMDLLLVSPVRPRTIILGKLIPYFVLSCVILALRWLLSYTVLDIPLSESVFNVIWITLLYIILSLGFGLLISALVSNQVTALLVSGVLLMLPVIMLSGMIFPIENMPLPLQWLSCIIPARWYISAMRTLMIQQLPASYILTEIIILATMATAVLTFAKKRYSIPKTDIPVMNPRILQILLKKEVKLMKRNPFIPRIIIAMPVMVMLLLPLVANLEVRNVGAAVVDNDCTELSRRIVADMDASEYLSVAECGFAYHEALQAVETGRADAIVVIPSHYSKDLVNGLRPKIEIEANGVDATKGMLGSRYAAQSVGATLMQWQSQEGITLPEANISVMNYFNPTLDFRNYMIPALMVVLIIIICGFLPTLNLVSEKEAGTIEAMNVTPVGKYTFVLSKLIPYWIVGILVVTVGMTIGWLVYGLVPAGNIAEVYLAAILFSFVMSGLGVSIANRSATILQSIFMMFAFIMIFQLMGGLFTPIASMPGWAQNITYLIPPRYFIEIMRAVYLKGATVQELWIQYSMLAVFAAVLCSVAALTYRKRY